jgi:hypothetical protein
MSGIIEHATRVIYSLRCQVCDARWESPEAAPMGWRNDGACGQAFSIGWRVYVGQRTQHTYCPEHGPKAPMRLLYGAEVAR